MRPHSVFRALVTKAAECLLAPRIPLAQTGASDTLLQMKSALVPEIRESLRSLLPLEGAFCVFLEVGLPGSAGTVLLEQWEFRCTSTLSSARTQEDERVYKRACMALRAVAAVSLVLPAVRLRNQLQFQVLANTGEDRWPPGTAVSHYAGRLCAVALHESLTISVGYRDPLPNTVEMNTFPPFSSGTLIGSGSGSYSPKSRSRLPSSGNMAAIAAKCSSAAEAGYLPLNVSIGDDADLYQSGSESGDDIELVIEFDGEEKQPATSAVFRRVCKEAQDLRLFSSSESPSLRIQLMAVQEQFSFLLKAREELSKV